MKFYITILSIIFFVYSHAEDNVSDITSDIYNTIIDVIQNDSSFSSELFLESFNKVYNERLPLINKQVNTYFQLKEQYKKCNTDSKKLKFIKINQKKISVLSISINDIEKANKTFNSNNYLIAFKNHNIKKIYNDATEEYIKTIKSKFQVFINRLNVGEKIYWKELEDFMEKIGFDKDQTYKMANKVGLYNNNDFISTIKPN